ncbi:MAG: hypothetical protein ACRDD1_00120, partial [Planctomycetia bacterium]
MCLQRRGLAGGTPNGAYFTFFGGPRRFGMVFAPLKGTSFGSLRIMARSEPNSPEAAELSSALGLFHQLL